MIGGKIDSAFHAEDRVIVTVVDGNDTCGIDLEPTDHNFQRGDSLWWQSQVAYWSPQDKSQQDIPNPRLGYSYGVENDQ